MLKSAKLIIFAIFTCTLQVFSQVKPVNPAVRKAQPLPGITPSGNTVLPTGKPETLSRGNGSSTRHVIHWLAPQNLSLPGGESKKVLHFQSATYQGRDMHPVYFDHFSLPAGQKLDGATLLNPVFEPLEQAQQVLISKNQLGPSVVLKVISGTEQHKPIGEISFIPLRINAATGQIEKLVSFDYTLSESPDGTTSGRRSSTRQYVTNSILSTGTWYRLGVTADGVYKINYHYMKSLGIDMKSLDPRNIQLYGNGGGMLPYANSSFRPDDLLQDAIYIAGEADGKMDTTDYILFYGAGPTKWTYHANASVGSPKFQHALNKYCDTTYYFLCIDQAINPSKRMPVYIENGSAPTVQVNTFDDYAMAENDAVNLITSGREWYGEVFSAVNSYTYPFNFPNIDPTSRVRVRADLMARNDLQPTYFNFNCPGISTVIPVAGVDFQAYWSLYASGGDTTLSFLPSSSSVSVTISKQASGSSAVGVGWMNYVEVNARRNLVMNGTEMTFRDTVSTGPGKVSSFNIAQANSKLTVWDISNVTNTAWQNSHLTATTLSFITRTDSLRQFVVFDSTALMPAPFPIGRVANQNLHASPQADLIIISHPDFLVQAQRLALLHQEQDTLSSVVVTPQQIYNEFSSGGQDAVGIRDFVKMFYDRSVTAGTPPRYLLLVGGGSYDPKNRLPGNTNYIIAFENANSWDYSNSYVSDEFFGLLDDNEGRWDSGSDVGFIDIGVGRLPVKTADQAKGIVDKIAKYTSIGSPPPITACNTSNCSPMGEWRNQVCFIADDDASDFISQAEQEVTMVDTSHWSRNYNIDKIYLDSYQEEMTPGGGLYPTVTSAINNRVALGALIINYTGHGGELGFSHKRVLEVSNINSWTNFCNMPLFMTATCEFSRFDNPGIVSAGDYILLNPAGAGIGLLSTVRLTYSGPNFYLNENFYRCVFTPIQGGMPRLGDVYRITEVSSGNDINNRNFTLLGDPAVRLAYPHYDCKTTDINTASLLTNATDTVHALDQVTIKGYVTDKSGNKLSNFNGTLYPTVFDKPTKLTTLSNDGVSLSPPWNFTLQKSTIYKGKATIKNGMFQFSFIVPKDIAYNYGSGRISYYFENGVTDGAGRNNQIIIGGSSLTAKPDTKGPNVKLFMNDSTFVYDGTTNESPQLYAVLFDSSGMNTVGNGVGHDLVAVLDNNSSSPAILNDYYTADINTFRSGKIRYPYTGLTEGVHTLKLKVWDVYDNSSQVFTEFIVSASAQMALKHVLNYPNPFTTHTSFFFEDNECCQNLNVEIEIFTVTGKLVKTIYTNIYSDGFRSPPIDWDGRDDFGDKIGRGVYVYRLSVRPDGKQPISKLEKLVILN
jgi:hypothetical protein